MPIIRTNSCAAYVNLALSIHKDNWLTNEDVKEVIRGFGKYFQNNTIAKELHFLKKKGGVKAEYVKGKPYKRYKYVNID